MEPLPPSLQLAAAIRNAAWMVRHYARGRRSSIQRTQRAQAIQQLGLACRRAFNTTDDFEPILLAIVEGLAPHDEPRF